MGSEQEPTVVSIRWVLGEGSYFQAIKLSTSKWFTRSTVSLVSVNNNNNNNLPCTYGMTRDILDEVAATETAEAGVAPKDVPTRYKGVQYFLDGSAPLTNAALKKEKVCNRVPVTSVWKFATNIAALREAEVDAARRRTRNQKNEGNR